MEDGGGAAKHRLSQHVRTFPAVGGNNLVGHRFIAPNEQAALFHHPAEEILVFSGAKFRPKRRVAILEELRLQQQVARSPSAPTDHIPRGMSRPLVEVSLHNPCRRFFVEVALYRSK